MTTISNFDNLSVGSGTFSTLLVSPIGNYHEHEGIMAQFFDFTPWTGKGKFLQLRKNQGWYCLFMSEYDDTKLPEGWEDSELIIDLAPNIRGESNG